MKCRKVEMSDRERDILQIEGLVMWIQAREEGLVNMLGTCPWYRHWWHVVRG